jgi:hypothetical protein
VTEEIQVGLRVRVADGGEKSIDRIAIGIIYYHEIMYGGVMKNSFFQRIISGIGVTLSPEKLEDLPEKRVDRRESFLSWLLKSEILPSASAAKGSRDTAFFSWLFAPESLPKDPPPAGASVRPSFFAVLFSREGLPEDHPPRSAPGSSGSRG